MHDLKDLRTRPDYYKDKFSKRDKNLTLLFEEVLKLDQQKREIQSKADELRKRKNEIADEIGRSKENKDRVEELKKEGTDVNSTLAEIEKEEMDLTHKLTEKATWLPNIVCDSVPLGENETNNTEILKWGNPRTE